MTDSTLVTPVNSASQSTRRASADPLDARRVVLAAFIGAIPLELLLRTVPGINVPLSALGAAAALLYVSARDARALRPRFVLMLVLVALASIAAIRAPSMLWFGMFVAMIATMTLAALPDGAWLRAMDPIGLLARGFEIVVRAGMGPLWMLQRAVDMKAVMPNDRAAVRHARGIALGLVVLLPFLVLFLSADPAFEALALELVDLPQLLSHVFLWGVLAWLALGWLGASLFAPERETPEIGMGSGEATWVLGLLALLFAAFVAVQFHYFFGGAELVHEVTGLSYAEYARRGFFELVTVAALLLVVLLAVDWLTRSAEPASRRVIRILSVVLIALLAVILLSAIQRMRLYVDVFGLTQDRFFTTAFMFWLALVFVWFGATVLLGHRERFMGGVYASGVAAILLLAAIDPIGRIARFNVAHGERTGRLDVVHLAQLGPDAAPWVLASLDRAEPEQRCAIAKELLGWIGDDAGDWDLRSWNLSRERARALVLPLRDSLTRDCDPPLQGETR